MPAIVWRARVFRILRRSGPRFRRPSLYSLAVLRVLWVTAEVPDAGLSGGSIRQYHLLSALVDHAEIDLALTGSLIDDQLRARLGRVFEFPTPPPGRPPRGRWSRRANDLWTAIAARNSFEVAEMRPTRDLFRGVAADTSAYDIVNIEHGYLAPLLPRQRSNRWMVTFHNVDSERSRQRAAVARGRRQAWLWSRDAARARRMEQWAVRAYDRVVAVSDDDARVLGGTVAVVPNGVDLERFPVTPLPPEPRLLFSGNFSYPPNIDAAQWLCGEVLPRVLETIPTATLDLVGLNPVPKVWALAELPAVTVHPNVASVGPYLEAARVAVVPLRIGTGTRLKALEAMAAGRPLAGTTIGLEGLGLVDGDTAAVADDAPAMARAIVALLTDDARARRQAAAARTQAEPFSWERVRARFVDAVLALAATEPKLQPQSRRG